MAALTAVEQSEALRYLGYANWENLASSFQLGFPSQSQPEFLIRDAFGRITDEGLELVRRDLRELRDIEHQMSDARKRFKASKIGELVLNDSEVQMLERAYVRWAGMLASDLGGYPNPFGGRNAHVVNG